MKKYSPHCERLFNSFDEDKNGKITQAQLQRCIALIGADLSTTEAEMLIQRDNEFMGLEAFAELMESDNEEEQLEDLKKAFEMYKMEEEDCITPRSLQRMLGRFGEWSIDECLVMVNHFDLNGDGKLSFHEFETMMLG